MYTFQDCPTGMLEEDRIEYEVLDQPPLPGGSEKVIALMRILVRGSQRYTLRCEGFWPRERVGVIVDILDVFDSIKF